MNPHRDAFSLCVSEDLKCAASSFRMHNCTYRYLTWPCIFLTCLLMFVKTSLLRKYIIIYIYETCLLFLCNLPFSCITNRIFRLISIFVTARCFDGFSDVMFSPCMCFFTFFSSRVFLGAVAPWLRWVFLGIKALRGEMYVKCFDMVLILYMQMLWWDVCTHTVGVPVVLDRVAF